MTVRMRLAIRTPQGAILDAEVRGARAPTATGQVGLRPRQEPLLLVVEPGLVVVHAEEGMRFAATAGGLLDGDRARCVLFTPFAVVGDDAGEVLAQLERALATPDGEIATRRQIGELEQRILQETRRRSGVSASGGERG